MSKDLILDDTQLYFIPFMSSCAECKYFKEDEFKCKAFPYGIPTEILSGKNKHFKALATQDNDIVFEKK